MSIEEQQRRKRIFTRLLDMKNSKDSVLPNSSLDAWEKQSLPGKAERDSNLKDENPSTVKTGNTWSNIQTAISLTVDQRPVLQFISQDEEDDKKTIVLQNITDYIWEKCGGDVELYYTVLSAGRYGTGIAKVYYRADRRTIKDIDIWNPETGEIKFSEREVTDYNDIMWESVDIRNIFPDDRATDFNDAVDVGEREILSEDQYKYKYDSKRYKNLSEVPASGGYFDNVEDEYRINSPFADTNSTKYEVITYYNKVRDEMVIYANGVEILYSPIPYKHKELPFAKCVFFPKGKEYFWGIGIPELLEHDQATIDTILNIAIDKMKFSLKKPILVSSGEELSANIYTEPGLMVPVLDANNFHELDIQPPDRVSFEIMDYIAADSRRKVGADDPMSGMKSGGTATENAIAKESSIRRLKTFLMMLESIFMARLGRLVIADIQQFYAHPIRTRNIIGTNKVENIYRKIPINLKRVKDEYGDEMYKEVQGAYFEIKPDDIMGNFDVKVKANSSLPVSRELEAKKRLDWALGMSGTPAVNEINWRKVAKETAMLSFNDDGSGFLLKKEDIEEEMKKLAIEENDRMVQGEDIPKTEGATESHTMRHMALVDSKDFKSLPINIQKVLTIHAEGELLDQRKDASQGMGRPIQNTPAGVTPSMPPISAGPTQAMVGMPNANETAQPSEQVRM